MKTILIIIGFFIFFEINAQYYTVNLNIHKSELSTIKLCIDSVIDASKDKICIGYVYKGALNKKTPAKFDQSIQAEFNNLLKSNKNENNNAEHLILRINKIFILELAIQYTEYSYALLNLSFIIRKGNKYYEKFQACEVVTRKSGVDATSQHESNIIEALNLCFQQYENRKPNSEKSMQLIETDLKLNPVYFQKYNIEAVNRYPKGLYNCFYDFRDFTPDTLTNFSIEYKITNNVLDYAYLNGINESSIASIWGFSDGKQNFINCDNKFYPIIKDGNCFYIYKKPSTHAFGMTGAIFGLVAAINEASIEKTQFKIDLPTAIIYQRDNVNDFEVDGKVVICISKDSHVANDVDLFIDGKKVCVMDKGTYFVVRCNRDAKNVELCLKYKGNQLCTQTIPKLFEKELYIISLKNGKLKFEPILLDTEEDTYAEIAAGEFKRLDEK